MLDVLRTLEALGMSIPTKDEARGTLTPYHGVIYKIIHEAWAEWRAVNAWRISQGYPPMLYHRSISNYVFDAIARRAIPAFGAEDRVHVEIETQTFKLFFRGLVARCKKGGEDKLGCSIKTQAAMAFMDADGVLPNFPPETAKVEIVWIPNELWTQVDQILVVARDGDNLIWDYEIKDVGEKGDVIPFPKPPSAPSPEPEDDGLVKPKSQPKTTKKPGE